MVTTRISKWNKILSSASFEKIMVKKMIIDKIRLQEKDNLDLQETSQRPLLL